MKQIIPIRIRMQLSIMVLAMLWIAGLAHAMPNQVGTIKSMMGSAKLVRGDQTLPIEAGTALQQGDILHTEANSSLGFILKDNSVLSMGPASQLVIDEFLFAPAKDDLSLVLRLLKGTATFLTGMIGKLAPETVKINTPSATIGIRGTQLALEVNERSPPH